MNDTPSRQCLRLMLRLDGKRMPQTVVYFFRIGPLVKIGRSRQPLRRFCQLRSRYGPDLEFAGWLIGSEMDEVTLHAAFDDLRVRGELFRERGLLFWFIHLCTSHRDPPMIATGEVISFHQQPE